MKTTAEKWWGCVGRSGSNPHWPPRCGWRSKLESTTDLENFCVHIKA
jgi:hypothetical protein